MLAGVVSASRRTDDAGLVERSARGEPEAFDQLIRPRLDRLFRMALAIIRNESDARDAVQEACVLAWREVPRLRDRSRFDAWLSQILVNACRGQLRRGRRTRVREIDVEGAEHEAAFSTTGGQEAMGEVDAIRRAFDRLDPTTRALLAMHYVEERPLAEIGQILRAPVGTVKWRLSNARKALDHALAEERR